MAGVVATVQVEDVCFGQPDDDRLTLLRHKGRLQIVAKVFYLGPAG